ncbi:hypothetical protein [Microbacterium arborescens]
MTELVGVDAVPDLPADGAALVAAADTLAASGPLVGDRLDDVGATWHRVPMVYDAPETQTAATAVLPVLRVGEDFSDAARSASAALRELGESLIPLERTRSALLADIEAHRTQVLAYRASDAAAAEDPADPLAGWGPYGYSANTDLLLRCRSLRAMFEDAVDRCSASLRRIGDGPFLPTGLGHATAGVGVPRTTWSARADDFRNALGMRALERLTTTDAKTIRELLAAHPEWITLLRETPPAPAQVSSWWTGLDAATAAALSAAAPVVLGSLGGVPAQVRAAANRVNVDSRRSELRALIDNRGYVLMSGTYERVRAPIPDGWLAELDYLDRVAAGEVQLYLYDPDREQIIEMFGDPDRADVIMSFMPGTNTTMESFYTSTEQSGITALTRWQVENARFDTAVAGFVVKQGPFPQLTSDIVATGPQNNDMMEALGRSYADFTFELDAIAPRAALVSVEHSAGSAAGGAAETAGAHFDARVALAGIGMTNDWRRRTEPSTTPCKHPTTSTRTSTTCNSATGATASRPPPRTGSPKSTPACPTPPPGYTASGSSTPPSAQCSTSPGN